jgi:hypothetical protein
MEPKGSLLCSQEPASGAYTESKMNTVHILLSYFLRFILILSSHLHLGLPSGLFKFSYPDLSYFSHMLRALPICSFFIWSF